MARKIRHFDSMDREAAAKQAKANRAKVSHKDRLRKAVIAEFGDKRGPYIAARVTDMPIHRRIVYLKAMRGKSLRAAADAFCAECIQWKRGEVSKCEVYACPLHPYRTKGA